MTGWAGRQGLEKVHPMNTGGKWQFDFGTVNVWWLITPVVCRTDLTGRTLWDLSSRQTREIFIFAGDTALTLDMQLIPKYAKLDFAVLPIGDNFTMGAEDAIIAAGFIDCKRIIGVHYDTFGYIKIDMARKRNSSLQPQDWNYYCRSQEVVLIYSKRIFFTW